MKKNGKKEPSGYSLFTYLIPLLAIALITSYFALSSIINSDKLERVNFLTRIRYLIDQAQLELQVDIVQAYEAAVNLSRNESLVRWFSGDSSPEIRELALTGLDTLGRDKRFDTSFAARIDTEQFYIGTALTDNLSMSDPDDSWFFDTISMEKPVSINVDYNRELGKTLLWVNAQIRRGNRVIGAAGVGMNIDSIKEKLEKLAPGKNGMILLADEMGLIKLAYPSEMLNKNLSIILHDKSRKYVNLSGGSIYDFGRNDTIYTIMDLKELNLKMVVMASVNDFLSPVWASNRIYSLLSILLIFLLVLGFLIIITRLRKTISQQNKSQDLTIHSMSLLAELKDHETGAHIIRTRKYCKILAEELSRHDKYRRYLTRGYIKDLERSAPLHDIGKVGIPDSILLKPGELSEAEFEIMKTHTIMGARILKAAMARLDFENYFAIGVQLVRHHHEKWDGTGYPDGLAGEGIPLSARIMAITDVYDALRTVRPYKKAFSHEEAMKIIEEGAGSHFEPDLVRAFIKKEKEFRRISEETKEETLPEF